RHNDSLKHQKSSFLLLNELKTKLDVNEIETLQHLLHSSASKIQQQCLTIHSKKLEKLNKGLIGQ
ncbi:unnamed protein product, partial [Didymodactylos carnosus]